MLENINGVLIDNEVRDRVPDRLRNYVNSCIGILEDVQGLHETRRILGFYPEGFTASDLDNLSQTNPEARSPYTLIRRDGVGRLQVVTYRDVPELNRYLRDIGDKGRRLVQEVGDLPVPDIIRNSMGPMLQQFSEGDFSGAMTARLNALQTPNHELFIGRFDRYDDNVAGIKFAEGGWLTIRDNAQTDKYSNLLKQAAERTAIQINERGLSPAHFRRVVVCETIASGGLPAEMIWSGNTIPSEDYKRKNEGSISYAFLSHLRYNLDNGLRDSLMNNTPELVGIGENALIEGMILNLVAHEGVGHPLIIENSHQPMRELEAEILGLMGVYNMDLPEETKRAAALVSLAWAKDSIDSYKEEEVASRKQAKKVYAIMGSILLNLCEMDRACEVNSDGHIILGETEFFYRTMASKLPIVRNIVRVEEWSSGSVHRFELVHTKNPKDYGIELENGNHAPQPVPIV